MGGETVTFIVRNVSKVVAVKLQKLADNNERSREAQIRVILADAVKNIE